MAEVYRRVRGQKIQKFIALMPEVQHELDHRALEIGVRAEALLLEHRDSGDSEIEIDAGRVDRYVTLSDVRGQRHAMSIEYGRQPYLNAHGVPVGGMEGLYILHRAAHLHRR